jgi:gas vesicle protein
MGTAATKAKRKWNREHYTNITTAMTPGLANKLKENCRENGKSVTSLITELVSVYLDINDSSPKEKSKKTASDNRGQRRRKLWKHIAAIEIICNGEEAYLNNIPENLQDSIRYENAENSVEQLKLAIDELKEVYPEDVR